MEGKDNIIVMLTEQLNEKNKEIDKYKNILSTLEHHLKQEYKDNMDTASEKCWTIAMQSMYIYNYIQELKESDSNEDIK